MALRAGILVTCLLIAGCGTATSTTGSIDATRVPAIHGNESRPGQVTVDGGLTELTNVGGETGKYVIRMSPREDGEFTAKIDVADWSPVDMVPLREASGGPAEFTDGTEVVAR